MTDRILLVSHETTLSGAPIQLIDLAIYLKERGWEPVMVAPEEGPIAEKLRSANVNVIIKPQLLLDPNHSDLRELSRGCAVVIANTIATWQAIQAAHLEKVPSIWYVHETLVGRRLAEQIPQIRPSLALADALIVPTQSTAAVYQMWTDRRIDVVPYGIAIPHIAAIPRTSERTTFVTLGSFERRKGQDVLLEAVEQLDPALRARALFRMAGRNLDELFYESFWRRAGGIGEVELLGSKPHNESLALLAGADILIVPSRDETMPIVILEAMALGKAVISTDVGGIREWLRDGLNALVVPPEDPAALAVAIERCLRDPELIGMLGAAARRTYDLYFTIERYGADFERVIQWVKDGEGKETFDLRSAEWPERYDRWIRDYDSFGNSDKVEIERGLRSLREHPLISILLPVYNPDLELLRQAIDSVRNQTYQNWELCMADDASTDQRVRGFLEREAVRESRIKLVFREKNGHIAACSNSALALATGAWCALLDQDDALAAHALAEVANEIDAHPSASLIYSDEDKIDLKGARAHPFFKTDWNPELFLAQNYVNHLGTFRMSLLKEIGGFREGFDGSQDYDLALRCVERIQPGEIRHIPRILYHWRMVPGSLADEANAKPYAREAARRAIGEHLQRRGIKGRVEPCPENPESHRVVYEAPTPAPLVSIIIPTRDHASMLRRCIESIRTGTEYAPVEIIVVDNDSREPETIEYLNELTKKTRDHIQVVRDDVPFNFSRLVNTGARAATGDLLAFLNNDIEVTDAGWLTEMVSQFMRDGVGAVGARLWYSDGTLQHGGVVLGLGGVAGHAHHRVPRGHPGYFNRAFLQQDCSAVTAACVLVRKAAFEAIGGFNEVSVGINFSDIDFCLRLKESGWRIIWTPYANLVHHESVSRGTQPNRAQQDLFVREAKYTQLKWGRELLADPNYSPNLCLELPAFYPAFPPRRSKTGFGIPNTTPKAISR